ncbi:MAG: hypothetical protein HQK79_14500 [Desulfobacterales bacterium]|nr:hypothetical protein [Desulfobacterales bacterium]MBF0398007.1 hypothetical protein [Desulfobacterales bacterium]
MEKEDLLKTALELSAVTNDVYNEYSTKRDLLVAEINQIMSNRLDIIELVGSNNIDMMKDNHANHAKFVQSIIKRYNPEVLINTVIWVFKAYMSRGFHENYWSAQLNTWVTILKRELSPKAYEMIFPLYNWFIVNIPHFTVLAHKQLSDNPNNTKIKNEKLRESI